MLLFQLLLATPATAHLAMMHFSRYGRNIEGLEIPPMPQLGLTFEQWWFRGGVTNPPQDGSVMELPAGGKFTGSLTCSSGYPVPDYGARVCGTADSDMGTTHTKDKMNTPMDKLVDVRGCGLAIAYESDATKIQPEDFAVISVNYSCPWTQAHDFHIPAELPACPPGGCTCMWGWIHSPNAGGQAEMYTLGYRCNVTGATGTTPIPKTQVARKCPINKGNCTVGPKQLHYWVQAERNNNFQDHNDPPFYNGDYGFTDGAQTDLWKVPDESLYADDCDWAPGPQLYDGPWSNLQAGRPQWDGVQPQPLDLVWPTPPASCNASRTAAASSSSASSVAASSTASVVSTTLASSTAPVLSPSVVAASTASVSSAPVSVAAAASSAAAVQVSSAASVSVAASVPSAASASSATAASSVSTASSISAAASVSAASVSSEDVASAVASAPATAASASDVPVSAASVSAASVSSASAPSASALVASSADPSTAPLISEASTASVSAVIPPSPSAIASAAASSTADVASAAASPSSTNNVGEYDDIIAWIDKWEAPSAEATADSMPPSPSASSSSSAAGEYYDDIIDWIDTWPASDADSQREPSNAKGPNRADQDKSHKDAPKENKGCRADGDAHAQGYRAHKRRARRAHH